MPATDKIEGRAEHRDEMPPVRSHGADTEEELILTEPSQRVVVQNKLAGPREQRANQTDDSRRYGNRFCHCVLSELSAI